MKKTTKLKNRIIRLYEDWPLKKKLMLVFGATVILQAVSGVIFNGVFTKKCFSDMFVKYSNSMLCNIGNNARTHMNNVENISQNILYNERIYSIICSNTDKFDLLKAYDESLEIDELLKNISYPQQEVEAIYLYNQNGLCYRMNGSDTSDTDELLENFPSESAIPVWKCVNGKIYMGRTVYNKDTLEKIGTQILRIRDGAFVNEDTNLNEFISLEIITDGYEYMYSYRESAMPTLDREQFDSLIAGKNGSYVDRKNHHMVFFLHMDEYGWNLVAMMPLSKLYNSTNKVRNAVVFFGIFTCLLTLAMALMFCKDLLNVIEVLINAINDFEKTNNISMVQTDRKDEIGFLTVKYNDLVKHIDMLVNTVYKEQISRRNAQMKALQAQLNPHFIYNTLEIINWKAQFHGADDVSDMIYHLSGLIDAGMGKKRKFVTLEEELEYIDHYCRISKVRFGKNIEFRYDIAQEVLKTSVPVLILQPLVENAVIHGTSKVGRKGIILIKAYAADDILMIDIVDNGIGIEEAQLRKLNAHLEKKSGQFEFCYGSEKEQGGIGLLNANERIKLNYGDDFGIKVYSGYRHYCKICCRLPCEE